MKCEYHDKWIETMDEWINAGSEAGSAGKHYSLWFKNGSRALIDIGIWTIKDKIVRLMIELGWFYLYPHSLKAEERRIEILKDEAFYVILGDVVKVIEHVRLGNVLRKNEVDISNPDSIFHLIDEISKSFSDDVKIDIGIIIENLKNYESYVEY